jgi:hypothetical protein
MQSSTIPQGYDKVLQFNVYMKDDIPVQADDLRYTVRNELVREVRREDRREYREDYEDHRDRDHERYDRSRPSGSAIKGSEIERRDREQDLDQTAPMTPGERFREDDNNAQDKKNRTPGTAAQTGVYPDSSPVKDRDRARERVREPEYTDHPDDHYEEEEDAAPVNDTEDLPPRRTGPLDDTYPNNSSEYLEIFVKPQKGEPKLVYKQNGQPAEIVHRFSPRRNYDRYVDVPNDKKAPNFSYDEFNRKYQRPELFHPAPYSPTRYEPRNREVYPASRSAHKRVYQEVEDEDVEVIMYPQGSPPPKEIIILRSRSNSRDSRDQPFVNHRQRELINALREEKNALTYCVNKLSNALDHHEDSHFQRVKSKPPPPDENVRVPKRATTKTPNRHRKQCWDSSPPKQDFQRRLSPSPSRKYPFDINPKGSRTEWDEKRGTMGRYNYPVYREVRAFSPSTRPPQEGDGFVGYCEFTPVNKDPSGSQEYYCRPLTADSFSPSPVAALPPQYMMRGRVLGKMPRPNYIRDQFQPSYLG